MGYVSAFLMTAAITIGFVAPANADDVLGTDSRPFQVRYSNGATEKYVVEWTALLSVDRRESGSPAIPAQFQFVDTRRCHWSVRGRVERRVYLMNQAGERFEKKDLATVYDSSSSNEGSALKLEQLRSENCNDAQARFESDIRDGRTATTNKLPEVIRNDIGTVQTVFKSWPNVADVSPE